MIGRKKEETKPLACQRRRETLSGVCLQGNASFRIQNPANSAITTQRSGLFLSPPLSRPFLCLHENGGRVRLAATHCLLDFSNFTASEQRRRTFGRKSGGHFFSRIILARWQEWVYLGLMIGHSYRGALSRNFSFDSKLLELVRLPFSSLFLPREASSSSTLRFYATNGEPAKAVLSNLLQAYEKFGESASLFGSSVCAFGRPMGRGLCR